MQTSHGLQVQAQNSNEKSLKTFQNALADHENDFDNFFSLQKTKSGNSQSFGPSARKPQIPHRKSEVIELKKKEEENN